MTTTLNDGWYGFHFGSRYANSPNFNPQALFENNHQDCYVMMADFCSFSSFFKATEDVRTVVPLMTSFYTQVRKIIHKHSGMLDKIIGDCVVAVWGLHVREERMVGSILDAAHELVDVANGIADEWQARIDLLVQPKGLKIGLSKGPLLVIPRDTAHPGLSLLGNPINLAARLQIAAQANQLICSNVVYQDIQQTGRELSFQPYRGQANENFLEAKNFGPVKAWVATLR